MEFEERGIWLKMKFRWKCCKISNMVPVDYRDSLHFAYNFNIFEWFFKDYKICHPLHRSNFKFWTKFREFVSRLVPKILQKYFFSTIFIEFYTDFDQDFTEFRRIF